MYSCAVSTCILCTVYILEVKWLAVGQSLLEEKSTIGLYIIRNCIIKIKNPNKVNKCFTDKQNIQQTKKILRFYNHYISSTFIY